MVIVNANSLTEPWGRFERCLDWKIHVPDEIRMGCGQVRVTFGTGSGCVWERWGRVREEFETDSGSVFPMSRPLGPEKRISFCRRCLRGVAQVTGLLGPLHGGGGCKTCMKKSKFKSWSRFQTFLTIYYTALFDAERGLVTCFDQVSWRPENMQWT